MKNAAPDDPTRPRRESRLRAGVAPGRSEPPARVLGAPRRPATVPGKILSSVLLAGEAVVSSVAGQPRPDCGSSGPTPPLETAVVVDPWLAIVRQRDHAPLPLAAGDDRQTVPPSASRYRDSCLRRHAGRRRRARAERGPARGHPACDAGDLVEHFADDAPREERVPARTGDGRAFIDTAPGGRGSGACQAMRLAGDPHLRNGVRDENVGAERRARPRRSPPRVCSATRTPPASAVYDWSASSRDVPSGVVTTGGPGIPLDFSAATGSFPPSAWNWGQRSAELGSRGFPDWGQATWHCFRWCNATLHREAGSSLPAGRNTG